MKQQRMFIILSVVVLSVLMNVVDLYLTPPYAVKSAVKVCLFLLAPMVYFLFHKEELPELKKLFVPRKRELLASILLGVGAYAVIVGGYFLLRDVIDFSNITKSLTADIGVNAENFVFVALYISFCNSLLEEFFFRGFAFITLKRHTGRIFAYGFSAVLFAFYHVGMTMGWVHPLVFLGGMIGLVLGGLFFDFLNERSGNLYPSWLVHMFVNFGINTIGFILFGII